MVKSTVVRFSDGTCKHQIRVIYGERIEKKVKHTTVKNFGYLEDAENPDALLKEAKEFNGRYLADLRKRKKTKKENAVPFYDSGDSLTQNFTYRFLETIYDSFGFDKVFEEYEYKGKQDLNEMLKFLVMARIQEGTSRRASFQMVNDFYGKDYRFALYDLYRSLDHFDRLSVNLQAKLNEFIAKEVGRDLSNTFYDSTNTYFEIDMEDEDEFEEVIPPITNRKEIKRQKLLTLTDGEGNEHQFRVIPGSRKTGVSKEHQTTPIVQLGLMIDSNGLPICMQSFPGNTSDSKTMLPLINNAKKDYGIGKTIFVARS